MSSGRSSAEVAYDLGYAIKRAQHALRLKMDRELRALGITTPQYSVLSAIAADPGASNARLARLVFVTPQTMQEMLANLERAGLITRVPDASHGRILRNDLSPAGKAMLKQSHRLMETVSAALLSGLSTKDAAFIAGALTGIAAALDGAAWTRDGVIGSTKL